VIPVLSREEARAFDALVIETHHVPGLLLMENAGRGVVDAIVRHWPTRPLSAEHVVVVAGLGNNGGDGFVVARHLVTRGASVEVLLTGSAARLKGDARAQYDALVGLGIAPHEATTSTGSLRAALGRATLVVDAVLGTGLSRPVEGDDAAILETIREAGKRVVAIDVPSGLDADTGVPLGVAVKADLTVTFGARKLGLVTPSGAALAGAVVVADLGVPGPGPAGAHYSAAFLERPDVARVLLPRGSAMHKVSAGHVVVFAGSPGHIGAAVMCAHAALRAGAGLATIATWPGAAESLDARAVEVMTARLDPGDLVASVDAALSRAKVVVVGPGFGKGDDARTVVRHILSAWEGPSVVDADALAMFEGEPEVFAASKGAAVLTPHPGELGVLLGMTAKSVEADRFGALAACVQRARSVTVLKGAHTLIGAPDERPVVNSSGSSVLATAGAGDVLAGTLGAFACALDPFEAAYAAVYVHGLAGETWARFHADRGLLAHEIADEVPGVVGRLLAEARELSSPGHGGCPV
jgi:ADP-dependent NAD(P)H-hydrate dehydratase / NAD(P)H-hydrate epimerase